MSSSSKRGTSAAATTDAGATPSLSKTTVSSQSAADGDGGDVIQILVAKAAVTEDANCSCNITASRLLLKLVGSSIRHWALRVGEDVYELRQHNAANYFERTNFDREKTLAIYDEGDVIGTTLSRPAYVKGLAEAYIAAKPGYDFVLVNCQTFVEHLIDMIPKHTTPKADRDAQHCGLERLLGDIRRYATSRGRTTVASVQNLIDKIILGLQAAALAAVVYATARWRDIRDGIRWLLAKFPNDALTWIIAGLKAAVLSMKPLLEAVAGASTSAWNALSSPLGLQILAGVAVVVAACGVAWLAWEGGERFWRWWKEHGSSLDLDAVVVEMQTVGPGRFRLPGLTLDGEVAVRPCQRRARVVEMV